MKVPCGDIREFGYCAVKDCEYAHSLEELDIDKCPRGEYCDLLLCDSLHPGEVESDVWERMGCLIFPFKNGDLDHLEDDEEDEDEDDELTYEEIWAEIYDDRFECCEECGVSLELPEHNERTCLIFQVIRDSVL